MVEFPTTTAKPPAATAHRSRESVVKSIVAFFVLTYALSWAWLIPWIVAGRTVLQGHGWPTHLPSLLGPMLAAFVVTWWRSGAAGVRDLVRHMARWRIGWTWWAVALSPLAFLGVVVAAMTAAGVDLPAAGEFARFSGIPAGLGVVGVALAIVIVDGFGEETGWRGFAQPILQRRFGPLTAAMIVAAAWAGWHVPQFFLLSSYQDFSVAMVPVFVFGLACGAVVLAWIYNRTGSVLAVAVWHGLYNLTGGTAAASGGSGAISAGVWTCVVATAVALLVVERRRNRIGRPSILAPTPH